MHEKTIVKQVWQDAGLYDSNDHRLLSFLTHVEQATTDCWHEIVQHVRDHYPEYKEQLFIPIWDTGDKLLRLHLIYAVAPASEEETRLFVRILQRPDPNGNDGEREALLRVALRRGILDEQKYAEHAGQLARSVVH